MNFNRVTTRRSTGALRALARRLRMRIRRDSRRLARLLGTSTGIPIRSAVVSTTTVRAGVRVRASIVGRRRGRGVDNAVVVGRRRGRGVDRRAAAAPLLRVRPRARAFAARRLVGRRFWRNRKRHTTCSGTWTNFDSQPVRFRVVPDLAVHAARGTQLLHRLGK